MTKVQPSVAFMVPPRTRVTSPAILASTTLKSTRVPTLIVLLNKGEIRLPRLGNVLCLTGRLRTHSLDRKERGENEKNVHDVWTALSVRFCIFIVESEASVSKG